MHYHKFHSKHYEFIEVNVNGDWSGIAKVRWKENPFWAGHKPQAGECEIPAELLLTLGFKAAHEKIRSKVISFVEDLSYGGTECTAAEIRAIGAEEGLTPEDGQKILDTLNGLRDKNRKNNG